MFANLFDFFIIQLIYRPFFNVLVFIYQNLPWGPDMGISLIIFTVFLSLCLLPLTTREDKSAEEKRQLLNELNRIEKDFAGYPLKIQKEKAKLIKSKRKIIWSRLLSYGIYILYFSILYRVFKTGIKGGDLKLLYSFIPDPQTPLNTNFLGILELTVPSPLLNAISAILIIPAELLAIMFSDLPPTREDWMTVIFAPFIAFFVTYRIPSGQELFFTTSLIFIIVVMITREMFKIVTRRGTPQS